MSNPQLLVDVSIKVRVDVGAGTATVTPSTAHGAVGTKFVWGLELTNAPANADVRAYLAIPDHDVISPDQPTDNENFQGKVYPFQNSAGNRLKPTLLGVQQNGQEKVIISILFPGTQKQSQPVSSVVIIDM